MKLSVLYTTFACILTSIPDDWYNQYISFFLLCYKTIRATIPKENIFFWKIKTNNINTEIETKSEMVVYFVQSTSFPSSLSSLYLFPGNDMFYLHWVLYSCVVYYYGNWVTIYIYDTHTVCVPHIIYLYTQSYNESSVYTSPYSYTIRKHKSTYMFFVVLINMPDIFNHFFIGHILEWLLSRKC